MNFTGIKLKREREEATVSNFLCCPYKGILHLPGPPVEGRPATWLQVSLGEAFTARMCTKALRVCVESVPRKGRPVGFQLILYNLVELTPHPKLGEVLNSTLRHSDEATAAGLLVASVETPWIVPQ